MVGGDGHSGDGAEAEEIGGGAEGGEVCPPLAAMPTLPVYPDGGKAIISGGGKPLRVFHPAGYDDIRKSVHFSITHGHTFQSRSSRKRRLTVSMSFAVTSELIGASRKNYASCLKYATNCRFLPILKKGKAQKSLKLLSFFGEGRKF